MADGPVEFPLGQCVPGPSGIVDPAPQIEIPGLAGIQNGIVNDERPATGDPPVDGFEKPLLLTAQEVMEREPDIDQIDGPGNAVQTLGEVPLKQGHGNLKALQIFPSQSQGDGREVYPGVGAERTTSQKLRTESGVAAPEIEPRVPRFPAVKPPGERSGHGTVVEIIMVHDPAVEIPPVEEFPDGVPATCDRVVSLDLRRHGLKK